jgi:NADH-quinone oxidoreductase subunit J
MSLYGAIFYILSIIILAATFRAVTRRDVLHAVVYLIISFSATGLIFYLLGAPFLALLEIIIYAGAIMVLFLFIVMMLRLMPEERGRETAITQWSPAVVLGGITLILAAVMVFAEPISGIPLKAVMASPFELGRFLFQEYWFAVEIASFLLLIALVGALYLARYEKQSKKITTQEGP